jgi:hypothetical protein
MEGSEIGIRSAFWTFTPAALISGFILGTFLQKKPG